MVRAQYQRTIRRPLPPLRALLDTLNGPWHTWALIVFLAIVFAHLSEHAAQAYQIWVLGWPRAQALGLLGLAYPWLVRSEWLHYGDTLITLIGLVALRPAFRGWARAWWTIALVLGVWHHFEHSLLLAQALAGHNLFGARVPTSILQLWFPRVELHDFYNTVVTVPMLIAVLYHFSHPADVAPSAICPCARRQRSLTLRLKRAWARGHDRDPEKPGPNPEARMDDLGGQ